MKIKYIEYTKPLYTTNPKSTSCEHLKMEIIICNKLPYNLDNGTAINIKTKYI
jgi:hypothetical protein